MNGAAASRLTDIDPRTVRDALHSILSGVDYRHGRSADPIQVWVQKLFDLYRQFRDWLAQLAAARPILYYLLVGSLIVLLAAVVYHLVYTVRAGSRIGSSGARDRHRPGAPSPNDAWRELADQAAARGHYADAIRHLFRLILWQHGLRHPGEMMRGDTNRECLRLWRDDAQARAAMSHVVLLLDAKWYGNEPCSESEYLNARQQCDKLLASNA